MARLSNPVGMDVQDDSALATAAASIPAGAYSDVSALANPWSLVHDVQWQTISAYYDANNREVQYTGKPASNDSPYPHEFNHYLYDENTNTWYRTMSAQLKGTSGSGHIWNTAFDFDTGEYWLAPRATEFFRKFDRAAWIAAGRQSMDPATGIPSWWSTVTNTGPADLLYSTTENFNGCAIHPNLFGPGDKGLVCIDGIYIYGYRFQNGAWIRLSNDFYSTDLSANTSGGAGWYIASQDIVCVGGGTLAAGGNGRVWRVPAGSGGTHPANSQKGAQTPINVQGTGSTTVAGKIIIHPSLPDRLLILEKNGTSRVWKSDDFGASWDLVPGLQHPFNGMQTGGNEGSWTAASISSYGVIMGIASKQGSKIRLWRPPVT